MKLFSLKEKKNRQGKMGILTSSHVTHPSSMYDSFILISVHRKDVSSFALERGQLVMNVLNDNNGG